MEPSLRVKRSELKLTEPPSKKKLKQPVNNEELKPEVVAPNKRNVKTNHKMETRSRKMLAQQPDSQISYCDPDKTKAADEKMETPVVAKRVARKKKEEPIDELIESEKDF